MCEIHNEINVIKQAYPDNRRLTIFDVGGCNFHDSRALRAHLPYANIFSFEPDKVNLEQYGEEAARDLINIVPVAVSDSDSEVMFYQSLSHRASGSILKPKTKPGTTEGIIHPGLFFDLEGIPVQTIRLDTFCKLNNILSIDYLHIDVQGAEEKVIKGLGDLRPGFIFAETCEFGTYESGTTLEEFDKLMSDMGYSIVNRFRDDTLYKHVETFPTFTKTDWLPKI